MPCKNLHTQLSLFASRDLEPVEALRVGEHIRICPACRDGVASFEKANHLLRSYGRDQKATPGQDLWPAIASGVGPGARRFGPPKGRR